MTPEPFSVSIRRAQGKVVCIVSGELGPIGCQTVERMLVDLIEGQGNMNVDVDMRSARLDNCSGPAMSKTSASADRSPSTANACPPQ